jgi:hypothetical protein
MKYEENKVLVGTTKEWFETKTIQLNFVGKLLVKFDWNLLKSFGTDNFLNERVAKNDVH